MSVRRSPAARRAPAPPQESPRSNVDTSTLTNDQKTARLEIAKACKPKARHLLEGGGGVGKTHLAAIAVQNILDRGKTVAVTAPTHAAVAVAAAKLAAVGLGHVPCRTIQSYLGLEPKPDDTGRIRLRRRKHAEAPKEDAVVLDECSMVPTDLNEHVDRHLFHAFVLYVGDDHQIPPVGEVRSPTFNTRSRSTLREPVRQAKDNPVLQIANEIRALQDHPDPTYMDWSWCRAVNQKPRGVYLPGGAIDLWLRRAFESPDFAKDKTAFRYVCWTNAKVAAINGKIRQWLFGETETPFVPGETVLIRQPIVQDKTVLFNTNEEAPVEEICEGTYTHRFEERAGLDAWSVQIPAWKVVLRREESDTQVTVYLPRDEDLVARVNDKLVSEARINRDRWDDREDFKGSLARLQACYAQTVHTVQGATHGCTFVDVADIRRRQRDNLLEMKQLLYTAAARPTTALMLVGV